MQRISNQYLKNDSLMVDMSGWTKVPSLRNVFVKPDSSVRSNLGPLKPLEHNRGYLCIGYIPTIGAKSIKKFIHQIVAETFLGPCPQGLVVNHLDGNPRNNAVSNLEYCTISENGKHYWKNHECGVGSKYGYAECVQIFHMDAEGFTSKEIGAALNLNPGSIRCTLSGHCKRRNIGHLVAERRERKAQEKSRRKEGK